MADSEDRHHRELRAALDAFVTGDPEPYKGLWSNSGDVSLFGAFGGRVLGWAAVADRLDRAASQYRAGRYEEFEVLVAHAGSELGYIVWMEAISAEGVDGKRVIRRRRATQISRIERGYWRIVHQHSDPLVELQLPAS